MKISELARKTGIEAKTIRYYEDIGLLPPPLRRENGYRDYTDSDIERVVFIRRCRDLRIPLEQVRRLTEVQMDQSASCAEVDGIIAEQLEKVRKARGELALLEQSLMTLAEACQHEQTGECGILHRLKTA